MKIGMQARGGLMKTNGDIAILLSATFARSVALSPLPPVQVRGETEGAICCAFPSPLYWGERGRGERDSIPRENSTFLHRPYSPSPPTPLPRVQGRGETEGA